MKKFASFKSFERNVTPGLSWTHGDNWLLSVNSWGWIPEFIIDWILSTVVGHHTETMVIDVLTTHSDTSPYLTSTENKNTHQLLEFRETERNVAQTQKCSNVILDAILLQVKNTGKLTSRLASLKIECPPVTSQYLSIQTFPYSLAIIPMLNKAPPIPAPILRVRMDRGSGWGRKWCQSKSWLYIQIRHPCTLHIIPCTVLAQCISHRHSYRSIWRKMSPKGD